MTRSEVIALGATKVRRNNQAISAFKKYLVEDWGKEPAGCFGCSFKNHFTKWVNQQRNGKTEPARSELKISKVMSQEKTTYKLKDKKFRAYFKGAVLSDGSPDGAWMEWIKHLKGHRQHRESFFEVLPGIKTTTTKADKASAASAKSKADAPKKRKATKTKK